MRPELLAITLAGLLFGQAVRATDEPPSLALLEFLGSLVELDEDWISPMELDESIPEPAAEEVFGWGDWLESGQQPGDPQPEPQPREEP